MVTNQRNQSHSLLLRKLVPGEDTQGITNTKGARAPTLINWVANPSMDVMEKLKKIWRRSLRIAVNARIEIEYRLTFSKFRLHPPVESQLIVSMTSYPKRIRHAWLALESLFRQEDRNFRLILVLAESQFPGRQLPRMIRKQIQKGLEILWVERDGRSFDHLGPAYQTFAGSDVISVDDDKFFYSTLVSQLRFAALKHPGAIVGWRGWEMRASNGTVKFYNKWVRANRGTPSSRLFMPPGNGSLYPAGSLPAETGDYDLRDTICPNADDVWYWAMARRAATQSFCLGQPKHRPVWKQSRTEALAHLDPGPREFQNVTTHFGLMEALVKELSIPTRPGSTSA